MTQLGDTLSDERRRQGKSLVDVEAGTRIRARMLEALEHGDYDQLPASAYVKGYIQSYAKYLDIPAQPLLELYKVDQRFVDERDSEREGRGPLMPRGARYAKASRQNLDDLPADPVVPRRDQQHAIPMKTWLIAAVGIAVVFTAIWAVSKLATSSSSLPPVPTSSVQETVTPAPSAGASVTAVATTGTASPTSETSDASAVVNPDSSASSSDSATAGIQPFKLSFRLTPGHESMLKVTIDGQTVYNEIVSDGQDIPKFDVYRKAQIIIGRTSWITTYVDGERHGTPNGKTDYAFSIENKNASQ